MNKQEQERRARLMKMQAERLPEIKRRFEENQNRTKITDTAEVATGAAVIFEQAQKRNFNSNFKPGGKDYSTRNKKKSNFSGDQNNFDTSVAKNFDQPKGKKGSKAKAPKANKTNKNAEIEDRKVNLSVSTRRGDMVHHQRMLSQDVNAQATQHIIGIPVNKSRFNGYNGAQVTNAQLKSARPDPEAVRIIPIGGLGEFGIGKNMTAIEYKSEIILIDMGVLFASEDYPGVNYMVPDIKYLEDNMDRIKAILFTHAHLDHIGACRHLLPKFNPLTPIYATDFTIGMIKKQMSELDDLPEMNYQVVDPFKHEKLQVSEHLSVEFIPGNCALVIRTPNGVIYLSGDWRAETNPIERQTDFERIDEIVKKEGIALLINESTNIDSPGHHPHSEYDVGDNIGKVMDHYANGRVIISCFSSQINRIGMIL